MKVNFREIAFTEKMIIYMYFGGAVLTWGPRPSIQGGFTTGNRCCKNVHFLQIILFDNWVGITIGTYFGKTFNIYRNIKHNRGFSHYIKYRNIFCDCIGNGIATTYLGKYRMYKKVVVYVISIILCIFIPTMSIHATLWRKNVRGHVHTFNLFVLWEL